VWSPKQNISRPALLEGKGRARKTLGVRRSSLSSQKRRWTQCAGRVGADIDYSTTCEERIRRRQEHVPGQIRQDRRRWLGIREHATERERSTQVASSYVYHTGASL
jgi:hypothetical protein